MADTKTLKQSGAGVSRSTIPFPKELWKRTRLLSLETGVTAQQIVIEGTEKLVSAKEKKVKGQ